MICTELDWHDCAAAAGVLDLCIQSSQPNNLIPQRQQGCWCRWHACTCLCCHVTALHVHPLQGHTYLTYGPLLNGATNVVFEGQPTYPSYSRCWEIVEKYKVAWAVTHSDSPCKRWGCPNFLQLYNPFSRLGQPDWTGLPEESYSAVAGSHTAAWDFDLPVQSRGAAAPRDQSLMQANREELSGLPAQRSTPPPPRLLQQCAFAPSVLCLLVCLGALQAPVPDTANRHAVCTWWMPCRSPSSTRLPP